MNDTVCENSIAEVSNLLHKICYTEGGVWLKVQHQRWGRVKSDNTEGDRGNCDGFRVRGLGLAESYTPTHHFVSPTIKSA